MFLLTQKWEDLFSASFDDQEGKTVSNCSLTHARLVDRNSPTGNFKRAYFSSKKRD